jgi:inhibitor of cysteine peptidase
LEAQPEQRFVLTILQPAITLDPSLFRRGDFLVVGRVSIFTVTMMCLCSSLVAGALQTATSAPATKASPPIITITDKDNGKDVDLTTGGTLIVKLTSNPSTGYAWAVSGDPSPLRLEKTSYVKNSQSAKIAGAPGMQVLRFAANASGMGTLTVLYRRSWEYNLPPAKTFSVRVNVR